MIRVRNRPSRFAARFVVLGWLMSPGLWASSPLKPTSDQLADHSLGGRIALTVDGPTLVGKPLILKIRLTSTGTKPISYWCGGPALYPSAGHFKVMLIPANGAVREVDPTNGQFTQGSGGPEKIEPRSTLEVPLACEPLPAGKWMVRVWSDEQAVIDRWPAIPLSDPVSIMVRNDSVAAARWDEQLLTKVRHDDSFARDVAATYRNEHVIDGCVSDLAGTDPTRRISAMQTFFMLNPVPTNAEKAMEAAIALQLKLPPDEIDEDLFDRLMDVPMIVTTDSMLESILAVTHSRIKDQMRLDAIRDLRFFPQDRASKALSEFLSDKSNAVHEVARQALDWRGK